MNPMQPMQGPFGTGSMYGMPMGSTISGFGGMGGGGAPPSLGPGAGMGMEKRSFMSEEEENELVDRALKSVEIGIDVVSRSQGQVQAYA